MLILPVFIAAFVCGFFVFRSRGQKTADCVHKGIVAGILASLVAFAAVTAFSYV